MITLGAILCSIGFGALGAEATARWFQTGERTFLPVAAICAGLAFISAGAAWLAILGVIQ